MASAISSDYNRDELQSIQRQIQEKKRSNLDATDRILDSVHQSETIGNETARVIVQQGEQLRNIEAHVNATDERLIHTRKDLNKLSSRFGGLKNFFRPPKSAFHKSASQPQLTDMKKKKPTSTNTDTTTRRSTYSRDDNETYLGKPRNQMDETEQRTDDRLYDVHQGVGRLKELALQMNLEIENQQPVIDRLIGKVGVLDDDIKQKNQQMKKLL